MKPITPIRQNLRALLDECSVTPAMIEVKTGISCATVYKAMRGERTRTATRMAIARVCRRAVEDVDAAIKRSAQ